MNTDRFIEWLESEVEERGWSFEELGRRAHISSGHLSKIRTGAQLPTWDICVRVGRALKVPPENVFRLAGLLPGSINPADLQPGAAVSLEEIEDIVLKVPPELQDDFAREVLNMARGLERIRRTAQEQEA